MTVRILSGSRGGIAIPAPSVQPLIWDGRPGSGGTGTAVSYDGTGQGSIANYSNVEGGTLSPSYTVTPRVTVVTLDSTWNGGRSGEKAFKLICYDADPASVKPTGSSANPAAAVDSPALIKTTVNNNVFIGHSVYLPGSGNSRGDNPTQVIFGSGWFYQVFECYGPPFAGSPPWQMNLVSLDGGSTNTWNMPSQVSPSFPRFWQAGSSVTYEAWYDFVYHLGFSTTAGSTQGFVELWVNGVPQSFNTNAAWTLTTSEGADGGSPQPNGKLLFVTAGAANWNGSSANTLDFDTYRKSGTITGSGKDPNTVYQARQRLGTTFASVYP